MVGMEMADTIGLDWARSFIGVSGRLAFHYSNATLTLTHSPPYAVCTREASRPKPHPYVHRISAEIRFSTSAHYAERKWHSLPPSLSVTRLSCRAC
jgi:hypothetical protein